MRTFLIALALCAGFGTASAADLGGRADSLLPVSGAAEPDKVNWTGLYIGVQGGYGNANHNLTVQEYKNDVGPRCVTGGGDSPLVLSDGACALGEDQKPIGYDLGAESGASADLAGLDGLNSHGFIGGGRVGFDKQFGKFVVGVFGAYDFSNIETTASVTGLGSISLEKDGEWSLGGRAGLLLSDRTMAYVLAAYTQTDYDIHGVSVPQKVVDQDRFKTGATFSGITVGGGFEHALAPNIFVGLEYTHTFYDTENLLDQYDALCNNGLRLKDDLDEDKVMATLKVKLNSDLFGR